MDMKITKRNHKNHIYQQWTAIKLMSNAELTSPRQRVVTVKYANTCA